MVRTEGEGGPPRSISPQVTLCLSREGEDRRRTSHPGRKDPSTHTDPEEAQRSTTPSSHTKLPSRSHFDQNGPGGESPLTSGGRSPPKKLILSPYGSPSSSPFFSPVKLDHYTKHRTPVDMSLCVLYPGTELGKTQVFPVITGCTSVHWSIDGCGRRYKLHSPFDQ